MGKTNFEKRPKNANLCSLAEPAHARCKFFCHQKKRKVKLDKVREGLRPITLRFRANARKLILGSIGPPLDHFSVKVGQLSEFNSSPCFFTIFIEKAPSDIAKHCLNSHNPMHKSCLPCLLLGLGTRSL